MGRTFNLRPEIYCSTLVISLYLFHTRRTWNGCFLLSSSLPSHTAEGERGSGDLLMDLHLYHYVCSIPGEHGTGVCVLSTTLPSHTAEGERGSGDLLMDLHIYHYVCSIPGEHGTGVCVLSSTITSHTAGGERGSGDLLLDLPRLGGDWSLKSESFA